MKIEGNNKNKKNENQNDNRKHFKYFHRRKEMHYDSLNCKIIDKNTDCNISWNKKLMENRKITS